MRNGCHFQELKLKVFPPCPLETRALGASIIGKWSHFSWIHACKLLLLLCACSSKCKFSIIDWDDNRLLYIMLLFPHKNAWSPPKKSLKCLHGAHYAHCIRVAFETSSLHFLLKNYFHFL